MVETVEEYKARILGYLDNRDPVKILAATPRQLEKILAHGSRTTLGRRPAPGKWSAHEIVAHLADAELVLGWRLRSMVATPGVTLQWWDEYLWSEKCQYAQMQLQAVVGVFHVLRAANLKLLRGIDRTRWKHLDGNHEKFGRLNLLDFLEMAAGHDLNHLQQIAALLKRTSGRRR